MSREGTFGVKSVTARWYLAIVRSKSGIGAEICPALLRTRNSATSEPPIARGARARRLKNPPVVDCASISPLVGCQLRTGFKKCAPAKAEPVATMIPTPPARAMDLQSRSVPRSDSRPRSRNRKMRCQLVRQSRKAAEEPRAPQPRRDPSTEQSSRRASVAANANRHHGSAMARRAVGKPRSKCGAHAPDHEQ